MRRWFAVIALSLASCAAEEARPPVMPVVHMPWVPRRMAAPKAAEPAPSQEAIEPEPAPSSSIDIPVPEAIGPLSKPLRFASLHSPMPGGIFAGYAGDTGLDLVGSPRAVYAIADAKVDYAEKGHTRWVGPKDSPYCVRLTLDQPIAWKGHKITHAYYAHLSAVAFEQKEGADKRHVKAGEALGTSGVARGVPHLHLGLLLDNEVEQDDWAFILREGEVPYCIGRLCKRRDAAEDVARYPDSMATSKKTIQRVLYLTGALSNTMSGDRGKRLPRDEALTAALRRGWRVASITPCGVVNLEDIALGTAYALLERDTPDDDGDE